MAQLGRPDCRQQSPQATQQHAREPAAAQQISLVVGIGASAGGLEAFTRFFANMPANSGMAFVLVQHFDPQRVSMLVELLSAKTTMPVTAAADGIPVTANLVFVIPPNAVLTIVGGILRLLQPAPARAGWRTPVHGRDSDKDLWPATPQTRS